MKYLILTFCFLSLGNLFSQIVLPNSLDTMPSNFSISLNSSHDIQTSALNNDLSSKLFKGGLIDDNLIQSNLANHENINRMGREFANQLLIVSKNPFSKIEKLKKWNILYDATYNSIFSGNYSKDLFALIFNGNQDFIGDSANFSGASFQYIDFQTLGLGISHKKTKSSFSINFVNVQNYLESSIPKATMFFAPDSSEINLEMNGNVATTYTNNFSKGVGFAINCKVNIEVPWRNENTAFFQFKVKDFGFAKINDVIRYQLDTAISYSGFTLENLLNFDRTSLENNQWQDTLNIKQDTISKWIMLPAMIEFGKILKVNSDKKLQSYFGVKLFPTIKYIPKIYAGLDYLITKKLHAGISAAYGGFGNLRFGLYTNFSTHKIDFGIGAEDLFGLISKKAYGQMIAIRLKYIL